MASRLAARGHEVRVLSRREGRGEEGVAVLRGELRSATGLAPALAGVEAIVHCASSPLWRARATEVIGTRHLLAAAGGTPHLLYVSIVGVERIPYYYYRAKREAERVVEAGGLPWTILRATQFHSLVSRYTVGPLAVVPAGSRVQLIDASEVADRLVELAEAGPAGRAADMGGPEVLSMHDVARLQQEVLGRRLRVVEVPALGRSARAFRDGHNLCPERAVGLITYEQYLRWLAAETGPQRRSQGT